MNAVFISNEIISEQTINRNTYGNSISTSEGLNEIIKKLVYQSSSVVYVIDVHCTFMYKNKQLKLQDQGGVIIYRHLLNKFKDCQDKLKIVFYSPISKDDLVRLKPAKYVLKLLPFVELFPKTEHYMIKPEEWTFEKALSETVKENFPQLNNASENLLSGWALAGAKKIDLNGKKPLIIDDEWQQWKSVYNEIFIGSADYFLSNEVDIKTEFEKLGNGKFNHLTKATLENIDFVISDLYLYEPHESEIWKDKNYIQKISGYKLLKQLRKLSNTLPVVFQTSSNKIMNFRGLMYAGIDGYIVKDIRPDVPEYDRLNTWAFFQNNLLSLFEEYGPVWVHQISKDINNIELNSGYWWLTNLEDKSKDAKKKHFKEIKDLILYSLSYIKKVLFNDYGGSTTSIIKNNTGGVYSIEATSIIGNYGKAIESLFGVKNIDIPDYWLRFIHKIKTEANHGEHFQLVKFMDAIICTKLIHYSLTSQNIRLQPQLTDFKFPNPDKVRGGFKYGEDNNFYYHHIALSYIDSCSKINNLYDAKLQDMIIHRTKMYIAAFSSKWKFWTDDQRQHFIDNQFYITGNYKGQTFSTKDLLSTGKVTIS